MSQLLDGAVLCRCQENALAIGAEGKRGDGGDFFPAIPQVLFHAEHQIPDLNVAGNRLMPSIERSGRSSNVSSRAEGPNCHLMVCKIFLELAGGDISEANHSIMTCRDQGSAVRRECQTGDNVQMTAERRPWTSIGQIPKVDAPVVASGRRLLAVRGNGDRAHRAMQGFQ